MISRWTTPGLYLVRRDSSDSSSERLGMVSVTILTECRPKFNSGDDGEPRSVPGASSDVPPTSPVTTTRGSLDADRHLRRPLRMQSPLCDTIGPSRQDLSSPATPVK